MVTNPVITSWSVAKDYGRPWTLATRERLRVCVRFKQPCDNERPNLPPNLPSAYPSALEVGADPLFHWTDRFIPKNARVIRADRPETVITKLKKRAARETADEGDGKSPRDVSCLVPNNGTFLRAISIHPRIRATMNFRCSGMLD